jgi:hypothetical protein
LRCMSLADSRVIGSRVVALFVDGKLMINNCGGNHPFLANRCFQASANSNTTATRHEQLTEC